jgi:hypothetical protein
MNEQRVRVWVQRFYDRPTLILQWVICPSGRADRLPNSTAGILALRVPPALRQQVRQRIWKPEILFFGYWPKVQWLIH